MAITFNPFTGNFDITGSSLPDDIVTGSGTPNYNAYWTASGELGAEQYVAQSRGGFGEDVTAFTGVVKVVSGNFDASSIVNADIDTNADIDRSKISDGTANRIVINDPDGFLAENSALTADRVILSNTDGLLTTSAITPEEVGYLTGASGNIQTQLNGKQATGNYITALTGDVSATGPGSATATITNLARSKIAAGTANHVVINDGSGNLSSEATLAKSRGGSGQDNSSITFPASGVLVTEAGSETLTNKNLDDLSTFFVDNGDPTRRLRFDVAGTTGKTVILRSQATGDNIIDIPNASTILVGDDTAQTLTSKTINADSNTITNIDNNEIKASAAIDVTKLANGTVSNTEFQYLDGATGNIQDQLNAKQPSGTYISTVSDSATIDLTLSGSDLSASIQPLSIDNSMIGTLAAIEQSKLDLHITNAEVEAFAAINLTKLAPTTADRALISSASGFITASSVTSTELGYVSGVTSPIQTQLNGKLAKNTGDIEETSFSGANNQAAAANVTGLAFANGSVRAFWAEIYAVVDATSDLYEIFHLQGIQKGSQWDMSVTSTGDDSLIDLTITTAGQVQYTSANYTGFSSLSFKFRARALTV